MAIHVFPDRPVELRAPLKCAWRDIDHFLESRLDWIAKSRDELERSPTPPRVQYIEGEHHLFLGKPYTLVLVRGRPKRVELLNDTIVVRCNSPRQPDKVKAALEDWYRSEAASLFPQRVTQCLSRFDKDFRAMAAPGLTIRKMKARWGSCSSSREICLNTLLIQRPIEAIDYVITHELCHLKHFAHNKSFYRLMARVMPDWRARAQLLEAPADPASPANPWTPW